MKLRTNLIAISVIFLTVINLYADYNQAFYFDDPYGEMKKLNKYFKDSRDKSWEKLSVSLEEMSNTIINTPEIPKSSIDCFERIWERFIDIETNDLEKEYNIAIKQLSIQGAKGYFNDPLFYNEIETLKTKYDYSFFLLNKMKTTQYQIYYAFWKYPIEKLINAQNVLFFGNFEKISFILDLIGVFMEKPFNQQNIKTIELFIDFVCSFPYNTKLEKSQSIDSFIVFYKRVNNEELKTYLRKKLLVLVKDETKRQKQVQEVLSGKE